MQDSTAQKAKRAPRYTVIFAVLIALTLLELWIVTTGLMRSLLNLILLGMALGKASLVAAYYMHLRGDSRLYTTIFILPVLLLLVFVLLSIVV